MQHKKKKKMTRLEELIIEGDKYGKNPEKDLLGVVYKVNENLQEDFLIWSRKVLAFIENNYMNNEDSKEIRNKLNTDNGYCSIETYRYISSILKSLEEPKYNDKWDSPNNSVLDQILYRFGNYVRQLNKRHNNRQGISVTDEYDVQDLLHAQLVVFFEDVRAEDPVPISAGGSSRVDFLIEDISTAIEVKMTRKGLGDKSIGDQLLIDIGRYSKRNDIEKIVFFIYDPENRIRNSKELINDIEKHSTPNFSISVVIVC